MRSREEYEEFHERDSDIASHWDEEEGAEEPDLKVDNSYLFEVINRFF